MPQSTNLTIICQSLSPFRPYSLIRALPVLGVFLLLLSAQTLLAAADPVLSAIETTPLSYTENGNALSGTATLLLTDADSANMASATVSISVNYRSAQDVLSYSVAGTIVGTWNSTTGVLTLSGSDTKAKYQAALCAVKYQNTSDAPDVVTRTLSYVANDGTTNSLAVTRSLTITAVNDAPVLSALEAANLSFTEDGVAIATTAILAVSDVDNTNTIASAIVKINPGFKTAEDTLSFTNTLTIIGVWDQATGILTITGSDTLAKYQTALRNVKYRNSSQNPTTGTRTLWYQVNDGVANSAAVTRPLVITPVNDVPVLSALEATSLAYNENAAATAISATLVVTDVDAASMASATVQISGNYQNGQDVLSYTATIASIAGTWNATTATLTLSGTGTPANYQSALRAVKYQNTSDNPSVLVRTLTLGITDGVAAATAVTRTITVTPINDAPVISGLETTTLTYNEDAVALITTAALTLADIDNTNLTSATVKIPTPGLKTAEDVLSFTNTATIIGAWDQATGILTLTGSDTLAKYQTALRTIKYNNISQKPSVTGRTISLQVMDSALLSTAVTRPLTVAAVNDAPTITALETTALTYADGSPAVSLTATAVVGDVDNSSLISANVVIATNYQNGQDVLSFTNTANIIGTWNAATGTMSLSGADTLAKYQSALRAVKYQNTSPTPSILVSISFYTSFPPCLMLDKS
jgi:hypothetical protein